MQSAGQDENAWLPNAFLFEQKDKTIAVAIKQHGDVYSYKETHGAATGAMESTYYIVSYDAANMLSLGEKKIDFNTGVKSTPPQIIGKDPEKIWIFTDQLIAYHAATLKQTVSREKLEQKTRN